jgi:DNA/RNA-binding domain of Phe-tRNA-synthetase-like protein
MEPSFREISCFNNLKGWRLHFAWLRLNEGNHEAILRIAIEATISIFKQKFSDSSYIDDPIVHSTRSLLISGGLAKEKCKTSFELLAKRVLAGKSIKTEKPGVVFRDLLSLKSMTPWSILDINQISFPLIFRLGKEKETLSEDNRNFNLKGCPVLCDKDGKLYTPMTHGDEEEITESCQDILLVCYAPIKRAKEVAAKTHLGNMVHMTRAFRIVMERAFLPNKR